MANGRKTGGRQRGTPNKATADIKALAQVHGPAVIAELARMSGVTDAPGAQTEAARIAAMRELLDRDFGKATVILAGHETETPLQIDFRWAPAIDSDATSTHMAASATAATLAVSEDEEDAQLVVEWGARDT